MPNGKRGPRSRDGCWTCRRRYHLSSFFPALAPSFYSTRTANRILGGKDATGERFRAEIVED